MSRGLSTPARFSASATAIISSSEGVIRPERPMKSAPVALACSTILSVGTITPRSTTSQLLHARTTPTMFLPMSWTSPLTVAMRKVPRLEPADFSASRAGSRAATAAFITRADLTTWGRNILPAPKRSPTTRMPAIRGPSMTSSGFPRSRSASSVSASTCEASPFTSAWRRRSATGSSRQAGFSAAWADAPLSLAKRGASASSRSVASGRRLRMTSSTCSRSSGSISSTTSIIPALTMAMSSPARMAW